MNPFTLLSPTLWRAIAIAAALAGLAWAYHLWADHQRDIGRDEVRAEWQAERLETAKQTLRLIETNTRKSFDLQAAADKERKALNAKLHSVDLEYAESLQRLRNRPERPTTSNTDVPTNTSPGRSGPEGGSCTGAGLYGGDGRFLAGFAADAKRLQAALRTCRAEQRAAQETVNTK